MPCYKQAEQSTSLVRRTEVLLFSVGVLRRASINLNYMGIEAHGGAYQMIVIAHT